MLFCKPSVTCTSWKRQQQCGPLNLNGMRSAVDQLWPSCAAVEMLLLSEVEKFNLSGLDTSVSQFGRGHEAWSWPVNAFRTVLNAAFLVYPEGRNLVACFVSCYDKDASDLAPSGVAAKCNDDFLWTVYHLFINWVILRGSFLMHLGFFFALNVKFPRETLVGQRSKSWAISWLICLKTEDFLLPAASRVFPVHLWKVEQVHR